MKRILSLLLLFSSVTLHAQDCEQVLIQIITGDMPMEMGISLYNQDNELIYEADNSNWESNSYYFEYLCLPDGCYSMELSDLGNDGWGNGMLYVNTPEVDFSLSVEQSSSNLTFSINNPWCNPSFTLGCTDPEALNYDGSAEYDDGSCIYMDNCDYIVELDLNKGANANDYLWVLYDDASNDIVAEMPIGEYNNQYDENYAFHCLDEGCYRLELTDTGDANGGDGSMDVLVNSIPVANELFVEGTTQILYFGIGNSTCSSVAGCTDDQALNFDATAGVDDGSCQYGCNENFIEVTTFTGTTAVDVSWSVSDLNENVLLESTAFTINDGSYTQYLCVEDGCFVLTMTDAENYWQGAEVFFSNGNELLLNDSLSYSDFELATEVPTTVYSALSINAPDCEVIPGCTQPDAPNYNPEANINDGSCEDGFGPGGPMYSLTSQEPVYFSQLTPNPGGARSTLMLEGLNSEQETIVSLTTLSGQVVYQQVIAAGSTTIREELNLSDLATGMYLFKVEHAGETSIERWMKQ